MYSKNKKIGFKGKVSIIVVAIAIASLGVAEATNTINLIGEHASTAKPSQPQNSTTKAVAATSNSTPSPNSPSASNQESTNKNIDKNVSATVKLVKPSGSFVSSHHVSLSNNGPIGSVCITSPGAQCAIIFIKDGSMRPLPKKTTDSQGNVYWTWIPRYYGLSSGTWQVKAVATYGSQSTTSYDAANLEVSP